MKTIIALGVFIAAAALLAGSRPAVAAQPCNPVGKLNFVCGPLNTEDLVQVPGTEWIVASGMDGGAAGTHGSLHLVNARDKSWKVLFPGSNPQLQPDKATYGDCPGAPDLSKFGAHGLNLRAGTDGTDTLYVVNHGGRESIEFFTLDSKGAEPTVTWVGCAVMPSHTWPNSVAPLPDGGMVVTDMFDPGDPKAPDKMNAGENTGAVYEWHPHQGYTLVPGSQMSGNNGIEVSRDGQWIYVAAWGNKAVVRLSRGGSGPTKRETLPVGFLADNLRWAPDGQLMVAGQNVSAKLVFACFESHATRCTQPWRIDRWDTAAMKVTPLVSAKGNPEFGDATVGLQVGDEMFVGTFRGQAIGYFALK
jgi:SMP-30/Gluconolactonase/LRE-like region